MAEKSDNNPPIFQLAIFLLVALLAYKVELWLTQFHHRHPGIIRLALEEGVAIVGLTVGLAIQNFRLRKSTSISLHRPMPGRVLVGVDLASREAIYLDEEIRAKHVQALGPTGEGKTSRIILPWTFSDIEDGRGFLFIDGKGDGQLLGQIYAKAKQCGREQDFMIFSLTRPEISATFNPLIGTDARQVTERVFSAFEFTDPYYRALQYESFHTVVSLLMHLKIQPLPGAVRELLRDKELLLPWKEHVTDANLSRDLKLLLETSKDRFHEQHGGLASQLGSFCQGATGPLFNAESSEISLQDAIEQRKIIYFQLPTMRYQYLAAATGKLLLQCLESAVSAIQQKDTPPPEKLFSVYLDDFNDFLYPAFVLLLNKSRSANVGVVFSHQSMGDLGKIGKDNLKVFWDNTRTKIFMRTPDPDTASLIASFFGTKVSEAATARRTASLLGAQYTGEESVREVQEFYFHPDLIKSGLTQGSALLGLPNAQRGFHIQLAPTPKIKPCFDFPKRNLTELHFARWVEPKKPTPPSGPTKGSVEDTVTRIS